MPMLRSDLELVETYTKPAGPVLSCPVHVLPEDLAG